MAKRLTTDEQIQKLEALIEEKKQQAQARQAKRRASLVGQLEVLRERDSKLQLKIATIEGEIAFIDEQLQDDDLTATE